MSLAPYFLEYVKLNSFSLYFALFCFFLYSWRFINPPFHISPTVLFTSILFLGLTLRILGVVATPSEPHWNWNNNNTENDWINIHAADITRGVWFQNSEGAPSGRRPIGYPLFLGALYSLFGTHGAVAWTAHLVLFVISAVFIYRMGRMIFGDRVGFFALLFFCVYPLSIYSVRLITDEHLFLPVWYGGLYLLLRETQGRPVRWSWLWYGLCFGYAAMTRTHAVFMPAVLAISGILRKESWHKIGGQVLLVAGLMVLVNLPWAVRNYKAWGVPVLFTPTGCNVYAENNSLALPYEGAGRLPGPNDPGFSPELQQVLASKNEGLSHQICKREMRRWIFSHPLKFGFLGLRKLLVLMSWNRSGGVWPLWYQYAEGHIDPSRSLSPQAKKRLEEPAFALYYILLFSFLSALAALSLSWRKLDPNTQKGVIILASCFFFWFSEHLFLFPDRKYRYPLEPLMMIFASFFWSWLSRKQTKYGKN